MASWTVIFYVCNRKDGLEKNGTVVTMFAIRITYSREITYRYCSSTCSILLILIACCAGEESELGTPLKGREAADSLYTPMVL